MYHKYDTKTPEGAIRSYLLGQGFFVKSITCVISEESPLFYTEHKADISSNQKIFQISPSVYDKSTQTHLNNFIVTSVKNNQYQVKYFGEG